MKKLLVALGVLVVLVGGALAAVPLLERHAAQQIKADMERDGTQVESVEVGLLARRIALTNVRSKQAGDIAIAHWEASGIAWPLSELVQGRTPAAGLRLGDPLRAGRLEVRDLRMGDNRVQWTIGALTIEDFDLARYDPERRLARDDPERRDGDQFINLAARIAAALTLGRLEQKDTVITDPVDGTHVVFANLTVGRFDKGQIGSIVVTGFQVTPKAAKEPAFRIADFNLTNLDLRRPLGAIGPAAWRPGLPIGRVDLEAGNVSGFGGTALSRYGIELGRITSHSKHEGQDVKRSSMRVESFVMTPPARGVETLQMRVLLQAMGLKQLTLAFDCSGTEDRAKGEVAIERCAVNGPELGEVDLSLKFVDADSAFWRAVDEGDTFALMRSKAGLGGAKLVISDRGMVERSLKAVAVTSGQPLAQVRAGFAQEIRRYQPANVLITDQMTKLLDTVARFIENGGTLTLEAKPAAPIGMTQMAAFARPGPDLVSILGLTATLKK